MLTPLPGDTTASFPDFDLTRPADAVNLPGARAEAASPLAVGEAFGRRYQILRLLGTGGMGTVYHAWDAELGVAIALKVIRPEATSTPAAAREMERRFKQELVLARQITHRNVVRIHDLGEIDGIKYITMPYLEGSDLATVLAQYDRIPVALALRIARDVAAGLAAAHEAGIVHRDLKPANVMVLEDHAVIMDFGIASTSTRAAAPTVAGTVRGHELASLLPRGPAGARTGDAGGIVGTVPYMAPEQARGQVVDQRADIYALGLILYDMLLGRRDGVRAGRAAAEELHQRMEHPPARVRTVDASIPEAVDRLIHRCLQPEAAARFQTAGELLGALDRLDENGQPIAPRRTVRLSVAAAIVAGVLLAGAGGWWYAREPAAPAGRAPLSVVIADVQNDTGDPAFDRTLEPMLKIALEDAGFITAFDRAQIARGLGVAPPDSLDEEAARRIAVAQGLGVVLSASLGPAGSAYALTMKAVHAVTGDVIGEARATAASKAEILAKATTLAMDVRKALGDDTSDAARRFAMDTLSATSLEVVREYAAAINANATGSFDQARQRFSNAIALDPGFGLAYAGMAMMSRNLGQQLEAEQYVHEAVRHLDRMTERERYRTRGLFYTVTSDYKGCVKEYRDLIDRYASDAAAHNNLALCSTYLRELDTAVDGMRQVVEILPKRALYRVNLALYATYSGDFETGAREALTAKQLGSPLGLLPEAFSHAARGQLPEAAAAYEALGKTGGPGASYAASGLGDLAVYEGRFSDAVRLLTDGAAADLDAKDRDRAAAKYAAIANAELLRGRSVAAIAAADSALANSHAVKVRFLAARVFTAAGARVRAGQLAAGLAAEVQDEPRAYARIIDGLIALEAGDADRAIAAITEASTLLDTWIGHVDLARAYMTAGAFTRADSELDRALARKGEALALFLDEEPTYGFLPAVYYYQGRVREGLNSQGFADSYRTYLSLRAPAGEDPLLSDVRRRVGG